MNLKSAGENQQSFSAGDLPMPLAFVQSTEEHLPLTSTVNRSLIPSKRSRKQLRPSTAPIPEESNYFLPSVSNTSSVHFSDDITRISPHLHVPELMDSSSRAPSPVSNNSAAGTADIRPHLGTLPKPFSVSLDSLTESSTIRTETTSEADYTWAMFMSAYAAGRWDPLRTPSRPRYLLPPYLPSLLQPLLDTSKTADTAPVSILENGEFSSTSVQFSVPQSLSSTMPSPGTSSITTAPPLSPSSSMLSRGTSMKLTLPSNLMFHRMRNSMGDLRTPHEDKDGSGTIDPEATTTAATMRWAAARVNLAPLSLPSPEHELTDPMRGMTTAIPGSHHSSPSQGVEATTPGGSRSRLPKFWRGTKDVDDPRPSSKLSTIDASPPSSSRSSSTESRASEPLTRPASHPPLAVPPASAPLAHPGMASGSGGEYFDLPPNGSTPEVTIQKEVSRMIRRSSSDTPFDTEVVSAPAVAYKRIQLVRQTSSPLPGTKFCDEKPQKSRTTNESMSNRRAVKEEQLYEELGYLIPPRPPDEAERRRALHKFNIYQTGPDTNFDRIAHLTKLVFNTKGVIISLVDQDEQWCKSGWGVELPSHSRDHSFCAHAILQRGDEPMIVLDATKDWRFAGNPLVMGPPHIMFYAGAPLRTSDGHNIGSLAIIDDHPRAEFSPRQRHTLKEFAAIVMREMELWRDKIQLRIRDRIQSSMEQFSRECLEIDSEMQHKEGRLDRRGSTSMDKVYDRAAKLVKRTLDVEGVVVMDVSHCEVLETMSSEASVSIVMHHADSGKGTSTKAMSTSEYAQLNAFFAKYPDGKIFEGIAPATFRPFLPTHIQYALTVPIFNVDKRPFALLCAYNATGQSKRFLEGHELSYLRAIGVIILSAVLKRRMILADKSKSLFISNISHELRTPLHGILAAAELLSDTPLNHNQASFLQTVQACGTSLVETVNHVLDFTKLSGNSKSGGVENVIAVSKVDLQQLVEEAVDGCWVGHRARKTAMNDSVIGSVYSPPNGHGGPQPSDETVEIIVDIGYREKGWNLLTEKGGIRRILMNLFGNSLKFTTEGFIHVSLHELPHTDDVPENKTKVELTVTDTGKGISQSFLKNQLFHPFSQENPLQTGTGLGLAIVNSIVQSESIDGKVDVWSEEGVGTEIRIVFQASLSPGPSHDLSSFDFKSVGLDTALSVSLLGFDRKNRGQDLLYNVMAHYIQSWWGFDVRPQESSELGDIVILNEDPTPVLEAIARRETTRPFVILTSSRRDRNHMTVAQDFELIGGFCRIMFKPSGPSQLLSVLRLCCHALNTKRRPSVSSSKRRSSNEISSSSPNPSPVPRRSNDGDGPFHPTARRNSDVEAKPSYVRPSMSPRATTAHVLKTWKDLAPTNERESSTPPPEEAAEEAVEESNESGPTTIAVGSSGSLLKSSLGSVEPTARKFRVLVVEDNNILRSLLVKWLKSKNIDYRDAQDGLDGVRIFQTQGPFDVILLDMSMPNLDGIGATRQIRAFEQETRAAANRDHYHTTRILALTGMSSLDDKRRAFDAGVDGYLVKPVAFKILDDMFHKLGVLP